MDSCHYPVMRGYQVQSIRRRTSTTLPQVAVAKNEVYWSREIIQGWGTSHTYHCRRQECYGGDRYMKSTQPLQGDI